MKRLKYTLEIIGAPNDEKIMKKFYDFRELVIEKNEFINLTTITERNEFESKHLMDSVICYGWKEIEKARTVIDVGTGPGFPGIPLAILYPEKHFLLLDSLNKRLEVVRDAAAELQLNNVETYHGRAEDGGRNPEFREKFDLCVSRALSNLSVLAEYCLPFVKPGGNLYSYKTKRAIGEIKESLLARKLLGASDEVEIRKRDIPGFHLDHNIWIIKKVRNTADTYPRKAGIPAKIPL